MQIGISRTMDLVLPVCFRGYCIVCGPANDDFCRGAMLDPTNKQLEINSICSLLRSLL